MAGGATSPPILRAASKMVVPGSTSTSMLSIVTLNITFSSGIASKQQISGAFSSRIGHKSPQMFPVPAAKLRLFEASLNYFFSPCRD
jgi:hypothetical protein